MSFERVASLDEVLEGVPLAVRKADGTPVCLVRAEGELFALHGVCTHQEFPMADGSVLAGAQIECAWHGARFDCRTGAPLALPATDALPVYEVRVDGGAVLVGGRRAS